MARIWWRATKETGGASGALDTPQAPPPPPHQPFQHTTAPNEKPANPQWVPYASKTLPALSVRTFTFSLCCSHLTVSSEHRQHLYKTLAAFFGSIDEGLEGHSTTTTSTPSPNSTSQAESATWIAPNPAIFCTGAAPAKMSHLVSGGWFARRSYSSASCRPLALCCSTRKGTSHSRRVGSLVSGSGCLGKRTHHATCSAYPLSTSSNLYSTLYSTPVPEHAAAHYLPSPPATSDYPYTEPGLVST